MECEYTCLNHNLLVLNKKMVTKGMYKGGLLSTKIILHQGG
jgi:hypothetical protein